MPSPMTSGGVHGDSRRLLFRAGADNLHNRTTDRSSGSVAVRYDAAVSRMLIIVGWILLATLGAAACSDDEPEITRADLLAEIEGRSLSQAEIEERETVARALCQMEDDVLRTMWAQMDNEQLAFQDFVFTQECGDRNPLYADSTGRFVTEN